MGVFGSELYAAFDAASVGVALVSRVPGRRRLRGFARAGLDPGALQPSPAGQNLTRREEVRVALEKALDELPARGRGGVTLVLPDGIARLSIVEPPPDADTRDFVRFRLAASLPWPAADAIVDFLPLGRGRVLGAAVRRGTVSEYEHLITARGLSVERVLLGPLLALGGLLSRGRIPGVHAILGDVALCLAVVRDGRLAALRSRRRDRSAGEAGRLLEEAIRTARLAGESAPQVRLTLSGSDANRLREDLDGGAAEAGPQPPAEWPAAVDSAWLRGALS